MPTLKELYKRFKPVASFVQSPLKNTKYQAGIDRLQSNAKRYFQPTENVRARDIVRELPGAARTVARDIAQGTARGIGGAALSVNPRPITLEPKTRLDKIVFGNEPIRNLPAAVQKNAPMLESKGVPKGLAYPIAAVGFAADAASNFAGVGGGQKAAIKALAKAGTAEDVIRIAKAANIALDDAKVTKLIKETNPTKIGEIVGSKVESTASKAALPKSVGRPGQKGLVERPANELPRTELSGKALTTPESSLRSPQQPPISRAVEPLENIVARTGGTDVKKKVNLVDYIRTPDRVLKKIGLENESKAIRKAYDSYVAELPEQIKKIDSWKSRVTPDGNVRIFKFLDGQIGKESLDPNELKVATEVRQELENWADRLKLPKEKRITNYITHIFDQDLIKKEFPDEIANIISDKIAGSVYDPFTQQRLGKLGYKEDTFAALEAYVKRGTRKANLDPALEQVKKASEGLEQSQFKYVKQYIDRVNMRPTDIDNLVDNTIKSIGGYKMGVRPIANLTRKARQWIYRGTLGLNVSSALKNLSQGANTYSKLGEKYTAKGYYDLFKNFKSDELQRVGVLADDFLQDRMISASKKGLQRLDKGLFSLFEFAEKVNRGAAYYGAKSKALAQGLGEEDAIQAAKQLVRDTQFTFGSIDTPPILQSDIGKTLGQFQSFTLKQGEFLGEMLAAKDIAGLTRWVGASLAFVYGVGKMFGMEPKDLIPTIRVGVPPTLQLPVDLAKSALGGEDKYGNDMKVTDTLKKDLVPLVPGGVQIKKTYEGLKSANQGYSETNKGMVRFPVSQSTGSKIQNAVFGQYTSDAARDYFKKEQTPLGEKDSKKFKLIDPAQRQGVFEGIQLRRETDKNREKLKEQLKKEQSKKAQAADVDKWAVAYGFDEVDPFDSPTSIAHKLIKEQSIPSGVKDELAKKLGVEGEVKKELAKLEFKKSGKNIQVFEDYVFRRNKDGSVSDEPKIEFDAKVNTNKMQSYKLKKDYANWEKTALVQLKNFEEQYNDPSLDELERSDIEEKAAALLESLAKYRGYGGAFTKPKSGKARQAKVRAVYTKSKPSTNKFTYKGSAGGSRVPAQSGNLFNTSKIRFSGSVRKPSSSVGRSRKAPRIIGRPRNLV